MHLMARMQIDFAIIQRVYNRVEYLHKGTESPESFFIAQATLRTKRRPWRQRQKDAE